MQNSCLKTSAWWSRSSHFVENGYLSLWFPNMVKVNIHKHWTRVTRFNPLWVSDPQLHVPCLYICTCWILERMSCGHILGVRAEKGPPMAGTNDPLTGVLPLATCIDESSHAKVLSWPPSSSSSSLRVGAANKIIMHLNSVKQNYENTRVNLGREAP